MARDLRLLAGAVFLSAAGDLLALVVLALHVHELTGSGPAVSALVATTLVPMVVVAPLAGLVTDRFESVRVLVAASLAQAALAAALAFGPSDLTAILVLASLLTVGNAFAQPAEFTLVPAVAGTHRLTEATGVIEAARYAGFAAGPVLAAGLAALGSRPALLVNAVTFLAVAAAAGALRARRPPRPAAPGRPRALDGVRLLRRDPVLRVTLGAALGALVFISTALTVELFYVKDVIGASDTAYALVVCGWMAGMVLGATAVARRIPARATAAAALVALAVQGAGMAGQAAWAVLPVALAGYLVGGLGHGAKNVFLRSVIAVRTPEAVHGRAFAAYNAARSTAELGALAAGGVLVGLLGPRAALVLAGLGPIAASAAGLTALRRRGRAAPGRRRARGGARRPVTSRDVRTQRRSDPPAGAWGTAKTHAVRHQRRPQGFRPRAAPSRPRGAADPRPPAAR